MDHASCTLFPGASRTTSCPSFPASGCLLPAAERKSPAASSNCEWRLRQPLTAAAAAEAGAEAEAGAVTTDGGERRGGLGVKGGRRMVAARLVVVPEGWRQLGSRPSGGKECFASRCRVGVRGVWRWPAVCGSSGAVGGGGLRGYKAR